MFCILGKLCRESKVFFHTDAAQAVGKVQLNVNDMNIDLMSISGHKIYGPKGVGALYVRRRPRVRVEAIQSGGGQERGIRSGTVPTPLVVGLGAAVEVAMKEMNVCRTISTNLLSSEHRVDMFMLSFQYDHKWMEYLSTRLIDKIMSNLPCVVRNGDPKSTYPGCVNLSFAYVEGLSTHSIP